ncbi:hypothetical protein Tco_1361295 [Tanacetum coccineum]
METFDDWGSEDDETFIKNIKEPEVDWLSIDKDEEMNDDDKDEEDDKSIDIQETEDERTESDNDDVEMADATKTNANKAEEEENVEKAEEEKKEEELKGDDQAKNEQEIGFVSFRVFELEKEVNEIKQADHSIAIVESIRSQVPSAVNEYLGSSLGDELQKDDMEKAKTIKTPTQKKRRHDDKDQDAPAGPDQGLTKRKTSKDVEPSKKPKSTGSSKGTTQSQPKSTGKFVQAEEAVFEAADTDMPFNQGDDTGNIDEQPDVEAVTKDDSFKKRTRPPNPDLNRTQENQLMMDQNKVGLMIWLMQKNLLLPLMI